MMWARLVETLWKQKGNHLEREQRVSDSRNFRGWTDVGDKDEERLCTVFLCRFANKNGSVTVNLPVVVRNDIRLLVATKSNFWGLLPMPSDVVGSFKEFYESECTTAMNREGRIRARCTRWARALLKDGNQRRDAGCDT